MVKVESVAACLARKNEAVVFLTVSRLFLTLFSK